MNFALNEVDAMAKKAARGAGYSWGMAEEAGKAARWLCAHELDGVKALALALGLADSADLAQMQPTSLHGNWQASSGALCPLIAGAALADSAAIWGHRGLVLKNVNAPLLILPFAALAVQVLGTTLSVNWEGASVVLAKDSVSLASVNPNSLIAPASQIKIKAGGQIGTLLPKQSRATPTPEDWAVLTGFAGRTYAPATEESRLKGAGAGLSDNY